MNSWYITSIYVCSFQVTKKAQFSLKRKKSKGEADYGDLVCPMNPYKTGEQAGSAINNYAGVSY